MYIRAQYDLLHGSAWLQLASFPELIAVLSLGVDPNEKILFS